MAALGVTIPLLIHLCYTSDMTKEPTIRDVLDAMHVFSTHMDKQFHELRQEFNGMKQDVSVLKQDVSVLKQQMVKLTSRVDLIQETMVTKDYMEGRLVAFAR